jgi:regulator of nonsense transcripts 2
MKTQQAAEREEQQRIKNLVLNYDLRDGEDQDGDSILPSLLPNLNIHNEDAGLDKAAATNHTRPDKSGNNRSGQRARKLQLSDVDWYEASSLQSPLSNKNNNQAPRRSSKSSLRKPLGNDFLPNIAPPRAHSTERQLQPASLLRKTGRGKLSRKEILKAHAALKPDNMN